jgi:soluble lytic murein transglycosylase-like protein
MAIPPFSTGPVTFNGAKASPEVTTAIHKASARTGVDFKYLVAQAGQESSFRPDAKAATSSAKGLYQFIERTWLHMIRDKGAEHGLGHLAGQIDGGADAPRVADPALRRQILDLRNDPSVSALMAAEYAKSNRDQLEAALGRPVGATELYMAHFLGAAGATKFLAAVDKSPDKLGVSLLPEAAAANRGAFYDQAGRALSVRQIFANYAAKFEATELPVKALASEPAQRPAPSPASIIKSAIFQALAGEQLAPVTIDALMKLGVPGAVSKAERDSRKT